MDWKMFNTPALDRLLVIEKERIDFYFDFLEGLAERQMERHYGEDELEEDIDYANMVSE